MTRLVFETKRMKVAELGEESSVPDLFGELTTQNSLVFDLTRMMRFMKDMAK